MTDFRTIYNTDPPSDRERAIHQKVAVQGQLPEEIAEEFGTTLSDVTSTVYRVGYWLALEQLGQDPHLVKVLHVKRLEHQWQIAMDAWRRSQKPEETAKVTRSGKKEDDKNPKTEHVRRGQTGDVRYLDQARRILAEIRALCGAEGPLNSEEDLVDVQNLTPEEKQAELDCRIAAAYRRQGVQEDGPTGGGDAR